MTIKAGTRIGGATMKKIWGLIVGFIVIIAVLSVALALGLFVLLGVSVYFGIKYYQNYKKDKGSVSPMFKQWWLYTGILSLIFMIAAMGSNSDKDVKQASLTVNETFTTNDKGVATISGRTAPNYDVNVDDVKKTSADSDGKFSFEYTLKDDSRKSLRLETSKDYDDKTKKSKVIYVKPSEKYLADKESLAQESSRISESAASQKKIDEEKASDITLLSDKPTSEQSAILTHLANQTFPQKYPYKGSKIHTILGNIQPWTKNGNDWYSKYKATIVNAFGAKRDTTLEIRITPISKDSGNVSFTDY